MLLVSLSIIIITGIVNYTLIRKKNVDMFFLQEDFSKNQQKGAHTQIISNE